jgi:RHS repeat-associated protein
MRSPTGPKVCRPGDAVMHAARSRHRRRLHSRPRLRNSKSEISAFCVGSGYRFYNPSPGRWVNRDPIGEKGGANLYGFLRNSPIHAIDPRGLDYYVATSPAFCGISHRFMVGDDGYGNHYTVDFFPNVDHWYTIYRRVCGEGLFRFRTGSGSAKASLAAYTSVERHAVTTSEEDKWLAASAASLDGQRHTYCLYVRDCRDIDRCVIVRKLTADAARALSKILSTLGESLNQNPQP